MHNKQIISYTSEQLKQLFYYRIQHCLLTRVSKQLLMLVYFPGIYEVKTVENTKQ